MDPPSQSFIDLSTMEALEYKDGNASHIADIHFFDPQQLDLMQSQGRQQQIRHPQNRQQQDRQRQARHQESQQEDPKQYQESSQQKSCRKKMDPPSQSFIDLSTMEALEYEDGNGSLPSHIAGIHVSDPQQPDRSHHLQLLPLFTIPPCIHLTKNSSKRQWPISAFIAFLVLQTICRLPFRCCTDMQNMLPSFIVMRDFRV